MSWLAEEWQDRAMMCFRNIGSTTSPDVAVTIPQTFDRFWEVIDEDGFELRVTSADGVTVIPYELDNGSGAAFDKTARLGRLQMDEVITPGADDEIIVLWLYFDSGDDPQGEGASAVTITAAEDGFIDLGTPSGADRLVVAAPPRTGTTRPRHAFQVESTELAHFWLDLTDALEGNRTPHAGSEVYEEPYQFTFTAVDDAEADASALLDLTQSRFVEVHGGVGEGRRVYLHFALIGFDPDTAYTLRPAITTRFPLDVGDLFRTLVIPIGVVSIDVLEPAP